MAKFDGSPTGLIRVQKNFDICRRSSRPICNDCKLTLTGNITQTAACGVIAKARLPFETAGRTQIQIYECRNDTVFVQDTLSG
jgi:hypothetical protein